MNKVLGNLDFFSSLGPLGFLLPKSLGRDARWASFNEGIGDSSRTTLKTDGGLPRRAKSLAHGGHWSFKGQHD